MKKFYLVSSIIVGILVLIASFAQLGGTCTLYLFPIGSVTPVFLQVAGLGAIFGGLLVLYWKAPRPNDLEDEDESGEIESNVPPKAPPTSGV